MKGADEERNGLSGQNRIVNGSQNGASGIKAVGVVAAPDSIGKNKQNSKTLTLTRRTGTTR